MIEELPYPKDLLEEILSILKKEGEVHISNLLGSSFSFFSRILKDNLSNSTLVIVTWDDERAKDIKKELDLFGESSVLYLSFFDLPISFIKSTIITTMPQILKKIPKGNVFKEWIEIKVGDSYSLEELCEKCVKFGYEKEYKVEKEGQFSKRGSIFDIFPFGYKSPVRLDFFGDFVESIREFDPVSQRSQKEILSVRIKPQILNEIKERAKTWFKEAKIEDDLFEKIMDPDEKRIFMEYTLPLLFESSSIKDMIPKDTVFIFDDIEKGDLLDIIFREKRRFDLIQKSFRFMLTFSSVFSDPKIIFEFPNIFSKRAKGNGIVFPVTKEILFRGKEDIKRLSKMGQKILIVLSPRSFTKKRVEFEKIGENVRVFEGEIKEGFSLPRFGFHLFCEKEIEKEIKKEKDIEFLPTFGDLVVHEDYGVGIYRGLFTLTFPNYRSDFILIEYDGGDKLYVPVSDLYRIYPYRGVSQGKPRLDKLGSPFWKRKKERAKRAIKEMAQDLIKLYALRKISKGYAFSKDDGYMSQFVAEFPYEETQDQRKAIEEVLSDMESPRPMDRLVCGDSGYGKTEVIMRAAAKAVLDGKQVAILVPTTVLAHQHYETLCKRFKNYPVNIGILSRLVPQKLRRKTEDEIREGKIDIVVGTHALFTSSNFKDLGLLVIDEEHKFGVSQKERLKKMNPNVDVLYTTATPIPRTLELSLSGLREISVIKTPPKDRKPAQIYVLNFGKDVIKDAIEYEIKRGGQIFFIHNFIESIDEMGDFIKRVVPQIKIGIAHGKMDSRELEDVMIQFQRGEIDLLLSTSIVESGLDFPRANTMIINRADRFGLSDLYQLRGRVGRSDVQAYVYLLVPEKSSLSHEARKRLFAITRMNEPGAGMRLALYDLEIRGAGNLLGHKQSGHMDDLGIDFYLEILHKTMRELKGEAKEEIFPEVELNLSYYIPKDYILDHEQRFSIYRKLAFCESGKDIDDIKDELLDRFGKFPKEVENLLKVTKIKILAKIKNLSLIKGDDSKLVIGFLKLDDKKLERLIETVLREPKVFTLTNDKKLIIKKKIGIDEIPALIDKLF